MEERFVLNGDGTAMKTQPDREQSRTDAEQTNSETQDVNHAKEEIEEEPYKKASHKPGEMGGRALGRLHQFELERGLDLTEIESEEKDSEERGANEGGAQNV
jgi:hypothetical protein